MFTEEFLESLKSDPIAGAIQIVHDTENALSKEADWQMADHAILIEAYSLIVEMLMAELLPLDKKFPVISGVVETDCANIYQFLLNIQKICTGETAKLKSQSFRTRFRVSLGSGFVYEFSQGDLERVQALLNDLRTQIFNSAALDHGHKQRLMNRLEKLQAEMHKKVSDLDRFWGLIGDAGVVLGKLGNDAKPIVDRIREIADIVWQTQSRAEELPSGTQLPSLEHKSSFEDE